MEFACDGPLASYIYLNFGRMEYFAEKIRKISWTNLAQNIPSTTIIIASIFTY